MKRLVIILISLVVLSACQPKKEKDSPVLQESAPAAVGFSAERLAKIDNAMSIWVAKGLINGAVGLITRDGKIFTTKLRGIAIWKQKLN